MPHREYDQSEVRNAITAPDSYSPSLTIEDTPIKRIVLDVINQGIYWQLKRAVGTTGVWEDTEVFMPPGSRVLSRGSITGIRVRAAIKAANLPAGSPQAVVTIEAVK